MFSKINQAECILPPSRCLLKHNIKGILDESYTYNLAWFTSVISYFSQFHFNVFPLSNSLDHYIYNVVSKLEHKTCMKFKYVDTKKPPQQDKKKKLCYLPDLSSMWVEISKKSNNDFVVSCTHLTHIWGYLDCTVRKNQWSCCMNTIHMNKELF